MEAESSRSMRAIGWHVGRIMWTNRPISDIMSTRFAVTPTEIEHKTSCRAHVSTYGSYELLLADSNAAHDAMPHRCVDVRFVCFVRLINGSESPSSGIEPVDLHTLQNRDDISDCGARTIDGDRV